MGTRTNIIETLDEMTTKAAGVLATVLGDVDSTRMDPVSQAAYASTAKALADTISSLQVTAINVVQVR